MANLLNGKDRFVREHGSAVGSEHSIVKPGTEWLVVVRRLAIRPERHQNREYADDGAYCEY